MSSQGPVILSFRCDDITVCAEFGQLWLTGSGKVGSSIPAHVEESLGEMLILIVCEWIKLLVDSSNRLRALVWMDDKVLQVVTKPEKYQSTSFLSCVIAEAQLNVFCWLESEEKWQGFCLLSLRLRVFIIHTEVFFCFFFESFVSLNKIYACVPALGRRRRDVQRAARQLCFCCRWLPIKRCTPLASGGAASQVNMRVNELQCHNIYLSYISEIYICWQVKCDAILPHMPYLAEYEALTCCLDWRTLTKQNGYRADIVLTFLKSKKILQKKSNKPYSCRIPTGHHSTEQRTFAFFYLVVKYVCGH